jgi:hypothetical protein
MAKKKHISAVISMKDNMSATFKGIRREQNSFQKEVVNTRKAMDSINKKKMTARLNATQAHKAFEKLKKNTQYIEAKKKIVQAVILKDNALSKIKKIKSNLNNLGQKVVSPFVKIKDSATSVIGKINSALTNLAKGVAIPLTIATGAAGTALKSGFKLEQQKVSMRHFMGVGNKGKSDAELDQMSEDYLNELRTNANATPFSTNEVVAAGTRALQATGGNVSEAMGMLKLAEDMAGLTDEATLDDAISAVADLVQVNDRSRLESFGVKLGVNDASQEEVLNVLKGMYSGGAEKLSATAQGLLSTMMGGITSIITDIGFGMLEPLKPVMVDIISFIGELTPKAEEIGIKITEGLGKGIDFIKTHLPTVAPLFKTAFETAKGIVSVAVPIIGQLLTALGPVFMGLLSFAQTSMEWIGVAVEKTAPYVSGLIEGLGPTFESVGSILENLGYIFKNVFNGIGSIVKSTYEKIKPLIEGIGSMVNGISNFASNGVNWISNKLSKTDKNATGTKYFKGGLSLVGEHGPELVEMPSGSRVYTNRETNAMLTNSSTPNSNNSTQNINISIPKFAETIVIREDADLDKLANKFIQKLSEARFAYGG